MKGVRSYEMPTAFVVMERLVPDLICPSKLDTAGTEKGEPLLFLIFSH